MPSNPKVVLVTGAAGFIGSHLCETLLRSGQPVVGMDSFDEFYPRRFKDQNLQSVRATSEARQVPFLFFEKDIRDLKASELPENIQSVIHLAARAGVRPSISDSELYASVNINGTLRILEVCKEQGIKSLVFISSSSVYGDKTAAPFSETDPAVNPLSPYAASKRAGELYCDVYSQLFGLRIACLRLFSVYGPRQRPDLAINLFASALAKDEPITIFGDGQTRRDYTYVDDIVSGIIAAKQWALDGPACAEVFNLGAGTPVTLIDLVRTIESLSGKKFQINWAPVQPGEVFQTFSDISKAQRILGYQPKIQILTGIENYLSWRQGLK